MATYYNKNLIDGVSELPRMTQAEFDELSLDEKPINWICRNYTGTQRGIKSSDIEHGTGTVADVLNKIKKINGITAGYSDVTIDYCTCIQIDNLVLVDILFTMTSSHNKANRLIYGLPETVSQDNMQFWGAKIIPYPNFNTTPYGFRIYNAYENGGLYANIDSEAGQYHVYGSYITS